MIHLSKSPKKYECPQCKHMTFTYYVDDAGRVCGKAFGYCDRREKCGYHRRPSDTDQATPTSDANVKKTPITVSRDLLKFGNDNPNTLLPFLLKMARGNGMTVKESLDLYNVKTLKDGRVCFYQIDGDDVVRTGKIFNFNADGHRDKDTPVAWVHKFRSLKNYVQGEELHQCIFGEHLVKKNNKFAVVESEKTAMVMSFLEPRFTWLAVGGLLMLKKDKFLTPIKGKDVTLFPDNRAYIQWLTTATKYNFNISPICENAKYTELLKSGFDVLDVYELYIDNKINKPNI